MRIKNPLPQGDFARRMEILEIGGCQYGSLLFARDTPKIVLALALRAVKAGDTVTTTWIAKKTEGTEPNFAIGTIAIAVETSAVVASSFSKPDAGWPAGQYRVDVTHDGRPLEFSQRFTVKE